MPHLIVEYSGNVADHHDVGALLDALQDAILALEVAPVAAVRIRAIREDEYRVADSSDPNHAYIAIVTRIGPGRDDATKQLIVTSLLDAGEAQLASEGSSLIIAWSSEVQEIDANYRVNRNHIAPAMNNAAAGSNS